jgi:hypothetical protein
MRWLEKHHANFADIGRYLFTTAAWRHILEELIDIMQMNALFGKRRAAGAGGKFHSQERFHSLPSG